MHKRLGSALALSFMLSVSLGGTASAAVVTVDRGSRGEFMVTDHAGSPGARCGYGAQTASGFAFLKWLKALPPTVYARDRSAARDQQKVSWIFKLQRKRGSGLWQNVVSKQQTARAYDDSPAAFTPIKLYSNGRDGDLFRAQITVKWLRNGSAEGVVKYLIEYYSVKWTVGVPDYVFTNSCTGSAD